MRIDVVTRPAHRVRADVVVQVFGLPFRRADLAVADHLRRDAARLVARDPGALTWMESRGAAAPRVLMVCAGAPVDREVEHGWAGGAGAMEQADATRRLARRLGALIERACDGLGLAHVAFAPPPAGIDLGLVLEGLWRRAHGTTEFAPQWQPTSVERITVCTDRAERAAVAESVERVRIVAEATSLARSWGDLPSNVGHPRELARRARVAATEVGLKANVVGAAQLTKLGMGLLGGVAGGGAPPAMVVLEHRPSGRARRPKIALLGKGVTLDTGGYNLKTTPLMHRFTDDKAGAAAVIGAMVALARLDVDAHVIGVAPLVENVISRAAYKPGDVLTAMDGTTVFVESTDAEGRLVLADCLTWLARHEPDVVVDIATLTGAAANALGEPFAAVYGNDADVIEDVRRAGLETGELVWPMPIHPLHEESLVHPRAMIRNYSEYAGGASAAAAFLRRFVSFPWVHVDMAGRGSYVYEQVETGAGATGWGTSLLVETTRRLAARLGEGR